MMVTHEKTRNPAASEVALPKPVDGSGGPDTLPDVCGIVLAGTHAWGESSLEMICSRPLLPVAGRPLIVYVLDWLRNGGVRRASICANSDTTVFRYCLGDGAVAGISVGYYEDRMPRGPAGCARDAAVQSSSDVFILVEGTLLPGVDLAALLNAHRKSEAALTLVVSSDDPTEGDPKPACEPAGVYVASRRALEEVPAKGYQDIKEMLVPRLYQSGQHVFPWSIPRGANLRVRELASYLAATCRAIEALTSGCLPPDAYVRVGDGWAHKSARIDETACVVGPVLVGPSCKIEHRVTVLGPAAIDEGCEIERDAVVSTAAIWSHCRVGAGAIVDHCVLTTGSRIEPGLVLRETVNAPARRSRVTSPDRISPYWRLSKNPPGNAGDAT
jgi:mannose-1-phosphate guanylyltransferase